MKKKLPSVLDHFDPDLPPPASHLLHLASELINSSSSPKQNFRSAQNCLG